jgi:hypothetical protein
MRYYFPQKQRMSTNRIIFLGVALFLLALFLIILIRKRGGTFLNRKLTSAMLRTTATPTACLSSSDQTSITNIQNQIKTMTTTVGSMSPQPTSDILNSFNTTISSINKQIASLQSLPTCSSFCTGELVYNSTTGMCSCPSGQNSYTNTSGNIACSTSTCTKTNQQYNPADGTCRCINPYGLDANGNCAVPCTFPQSSWTGQACGCGTGYTLISAMNGCDNPSNDTINTTYLPQLTQFASSLNALSHSIPLIGYTIANITSTGTNNSPPVGQFFSLPATSSFTLSFTAVAQNNVNFCLTPTQSTGAGYFIGLSGWVASGNVGTQSGISATGMGGPFINWPGLLTSPGGNNQITVAVNASAGTITIGGSGLTKGYVYTGLPLTSMLYIGFSDYSSSVAYSNILVTYPSVASPSFQLVSATFGAGGNTTVDVTSKFATALDSNGNLTNQFWTASGNSYVNFLVATDPAVGYVKTLTVTYKRNYFQNILTFRENVPIALP